MFSKLFKGEFSLGETFWKFGVLGLAVLNILILFFGRMLSGYLQGRTINEFFFHHFHMINSPKLSILWTLCYVSGLLMLVVYSCNMILAVWRSAANYEKSAILGFFAKIAMVLIVGYNWYKVIFPIV